MTLDEALTFRWLPLAREIYPYDWVFHKDLALALRRLDEKADPNSVIDALDPIAYEEWDAFAAYALQHNAPQVLLFFHEVARYHHDEGWRYQAIRRIHETGNLDQKLANELLATERDSDVRELLRECLSPL